MKKIDLLQIEKVFLLVPSLSMFDEMRMKFIRGYLEAIASKVERIRSLSEAHSSKNKSVVILHEDSIPTTSHNNTAKNRFLEKDCDGFNILLITREKPEDLWGDGPTVHYLSSAAIGNIIGCVHEVLVAGDTSCLRNKIVEFCGKK